MSAHGVVQTIRGIARDEAARQWHAALGVVTSLHFGPDQYAATVKLRETGIVLPKVPLATGLIGMVALPTEGDLVLVVFANGDLHEPTVVGRLYDDKVAPPDHAPDELVASLPGRETDSTKAVMVAVKTPGDSRSLTVTLDGTVKVELEVADGSIRLQAQDTKLELTQGGASDGTAKLSAGDTSITVEQGGDVSVEAGGTLKLKGTKVDISADATVKIAGQTIDLN